MKDTQRNTQKAALHVDLLSFIYLYSKKKEKPFSKAFKKLMVILIFCLQLFIFYLIFIFKSTDEIILACLADGF